MRVRVLCVACATQRKKRVDYGFSTAVGTEKKKML
jgi:hypothetical protein